MACTGRKSEMKKRKIAVWVLICGMLAGRPVWAEEVDTDILAEEQESLELQEQQEEDSVTQTEIFSEEDSDIDEQKEDIQEKPDKDDESILAEQALGVQNDRINRCSVCINYPIRLPVGGSPSGEQELGAYKIESENEDICEATAGIVQDSDGINTAYITVNGIRKGTTMIRVIYTHNDTEIETKYEITVNELPEDAVLFPDIILRSYLCENNDINGDGCISKNELEKIERIDSINAWGSVKDLSGLEGASHLLFLDLRDCTELSDISVLFGLKNLQHVILEGTKVSDADRWKLADFKDCALSMGEKISLPHGLGVLGDELSVEAVSNAECIEIQKTGYYGSVSVLAKEAGEARLHISYKDLSTDIVLTIQEIPADQEVGEDYPVEIQPIGSISANTFEQTALILDSNSQLWQLYPEVEKKKDNVRAYAANWVSYGSGSQEGEFCTYLLDNDGNLWNDIEKLAENVERFDGRYALDTQGVLHNVYNSGSEQIENIVDWLSPEESGEGIAYILKKDGTLWRRKETVRDQEAEEWEQTDSGVKQLYGTIRRGGYLKTDGTIVSFDGTKTTDIKADRICEDGSFYDKEGNYYFYSRREAYTNVGKIDVKQAGQYIGEENGILLLSQDGQAYKYNMQANKLELLTSDVLRINEDYYYRPDSIDWAFQMKNGKYCNLKGEVLEQAAIEVKGGQSPSYSLIWYEDGSQVVKRNGISILNNVTSVWSDRIEGKWLTFACRKDGTVWNITGVPKKILDLNPASYIKGDVNEDGEVNIKDLQIILRGVCEKINLTDRQIMIADVEKDGKVDIYDLRKELRFVCGKLESLD